MSKVSGDQLVAPEITSAATSTGTDPIVVQWRELQSTYLKAAGVLEREISHQYGIGLSEFEVLDLVAESLDDDNPCRMKDLGSISPMTQSALSRVVDRLEKAGLVTRNTCDDDRRALLVGLTKAGHKLHDQAAETHRDLLSDLLAP